MPVEVGPYRGGAREFFTAVERAFGEQFNDTVLPVWEPLLEVDRALAAADGDRIVGTAAIITFELTVPGGQLPTAGVSMVTVQPTHRRRGILRQLMRRQIDDVHERGEPLAALWASEGQIYQRFGYGLASLRGRIEVPRQRSAFRTPHVPAGSIRFAELDEAREAIPPVFDAYRPTRPGCFTRSPAFWASEFFHDPERVRRGAGPAFHVLHESDGRTDGYARYRIKREWSERGPKSVLSVVELIGLDPGAHLDLWRFLLDVDLIETIDAWNLPADEPLLLTVAEPRRLGFGVSDALWLRIVDAPAALRGRRYLGNGSVVIELTDEFCPWNAGRWELTVRDGQAEVEATSSSADLALDATDLAALYLGTFRVADLLRAGRGAELRDGAASCADEMLRTEIAPWCPIVF